MAIVSENITIHRDGAGHANEVKPLIEALQDVAKSRSTRDFYRAVEAGGVRCFLRVPLTSDVQAVDSAALGRVMRKVLREAVEAAGSGDQIVVDFLPDPDGGLRIAAGPATEMGGLEPATLKVFQ
ncbi:hypothetical protein FS799_15940 [Agrobacterium vitis]|uniref:hypothetical protein n=1 Tax=Agrobacterium vitis TaxID=373 RepID=UPI001F48B821|nr:hypothetical protein [Agrobacterium vitis]MCE6076361.1 hypothetical protein [Agrobacterium vitis]